ncbi:MAG: hypothetical protein ACTSWN_08920 [Promethearchaeota archaeon]
MIGKEDVERKKERMDAWWDHEIIDRPVIGFIYPNPEIPIKGFFDGWLLAKEPDNIDGFIQNFEANVLESRVFGGDLMPNLHPNYGPGIMAAVLGCKPVFKTNTNWFCKTIPLDEILEYLEDVQINMNNEWFARLIKITEKSAWHARGRYQVAVTDLGGVLDILASFLHYRDIFYAMKRKPGLIDACRQIILEKTLMVYDKLQTIIESHGYGCNSWLNCWCRRRWYPIQCDFAYMLSPELFKRFALPDIRAQAEHLDYAIYHLDGINQLQFLDDLLKEPAITGIQWVPGAGKPEPGSDTWMHVHEKILGAGKNVVTNVSPERISHLYKNLEKKGLFLTTQFMAEIFAEFFLPAFIGGYECKEPDEI